MRAPLARWLREEAKRAHDDLGGYRLLDVGCGQKPYEPFFAPYASSYVGVDPVENPPAELQGSVEALPVEDGSFDVVLCTQVLEHATTPRSRSASSSVPSRRAAGSCSRRTERRSTTRLRSTTGAGRTRASSSFSGETATGPPSPCRPPPERPPASRCSLNVYIDLAARRAHVGALAKPVVAVLNTAAEAIDRRSATLREPGPGSLFANFHVVAEKAR